MPLISRTKMQNQNTISTYVEERKANELSKSTVKLDRIILKKLAKFLHKPFKKATKQDLIRFFNRMQEIHASSTVHVQKVRIKHFYNWLFGLDRGEYPACAKWIRPTNPYKDKLPINPEDLLSREEIKKIMQACNHTRDQAIVSSLYESGARSQELLDLKVKTVVFDKQGGVITLKGKTGQRRIRLVESIPYLQAWLNIHPFREKPDAPLWFSTRSKSGISYPYLYKLIERLSRQAGIKKKVTPHVFRHSRLTELAKYIPEQKLKLFAGWTPDSKMASIYVHLSGKDLDEDILSLHGLETQKLTAPLKKTSLTPIECGRCQQKNPATAKYCLHCGMILDEKTALEVMERSTNPLANIIREETKDVVSLMKEMRKEEGTESAKKLFGDFVKDLQAEIEKSIKDVQNQNRLALKELKALTKAVEKALD